MTTNENLLIWTEKYRPTEWDDVVGQAAIVVRLKQFVNAKSLPHLLFVGPAGCGKSTVSLIIAKKLYGQNWRSNFLEMNSSDERGIATVRTKVKDFARTRPLAADFKMIFLDECDALTPEAQNALRRIMETYAGTCRFILAANFSNRIIDPIQSRCAVFRFKGVTTEEIKQRIASIAAKEKLIISAPALGAIAELADGDIRRAINILQAAASVSPTVEEKTIYETAATAKPAEVKQLMNAAIAGKFTDARRLLMQLLHGQGIPGEELIRAIERELWSMELPETKRALALERLAECEHRLQGGSDPQIQLAALLAGLVTK